MVGRVCSVMVRAGLGVMGSTSARQSRRCRVRMFIGGGRVMLRLGLEYRAARYRIVYVGALAVLFVFVVRLLDVSRWGLRPEEKASKGGEMPAIGVAMVIGGIFARVANQEPENYVLDTIELDITGMRDEVSLMGGYGKYRYTEGGVYVRAVGLVRLTARLGGVRRSGQSGYVSGKERSKGQLVGEQLSRETGKYGR